MQTPAEDVDDTERRRAARARVDEARRTARRLLDERREQLRRDRDDGTRGAAPPRRLDLRTAR